MDERDRIRHIVGPGDEAANRGGLYGSSGECASSDYS
jgi:hypothetical protein